ncbi:MAG: hypothetical protein D3916_05290 [Candidatus Electrothrix sp. MAN1_4]|nr:hypothetical protein [Candidatus Electrothrix sp. MAN1_4]
MTQPFLVLKKSFGNTLQKNLQKNLQKKMGHYGRHEAQKTPWSGGTKHLETKKMPHKTVKKISGMLLWYALGMARISLFFTILFMVSPSQLWAQPTMVMVRAPERASGDFHFTIDVHHAIALDSGQFDLQYDPAAIQMIDVENNSVIADNPVPVALWTILKPGRIRVIFNFPGAQGINGSGHLATVKARAIGKKGQTSGLDIDNGLLVSKETKIIASKWVDGSLKIETLAPKMNRIATTPPKSNPQPENNPQGIAISTPMALTGLGFLIAIPGLFLILFRKKRTRNRVGSS